VLVEQTLDSPFAPGINRKDRDLRCDIAAVGAVELCVECQVAIAHS